jgi:hypothetical protein
VNPAEIIPEKVATGEESPTYNVLLQDVEAVM